MVLKSVSDLVSAHAVFSRARRFAGLALKPAKCNIVPLAAQWSDELSSVIRHRLSTRIHEWQAFQVLPCCRYLGLYLGPASGQMHWISPLSKWGSCSELIAATGCPPMAAALLYNARAVTTLSYVGQLVPPPADFQRREVRVLNRLFHFANSAVDYAGFSNLARYGFPKITLASATVRASMSRAALVSTCSWKLCKVQVMDACLEHLPLASVSGKCSPCLPFMDPFVI